MLKISIQRGIVLSSCVSKHPYCVLAVQQRMSLQAEEVYTVLAHTRSLVRSTAFFSTKELTSVPDRPSSSLLPVLSAYQWESR